MTYVLDGIKSHVQSAVSFSEQAVDNLKTPYTALIKSTRCAKTLHAFIGEVWSVSELSTRVFQYLAPLKVLHIPVYTIRSVQSTTSLVTSDTHSDRICSVWKLYSALKKLTSGVEAAVACLSQITPVSSAVYNTFNFLGFVFLPNTTIEAAIGTYKTAGRVKLYRASEKHFQAAKDVKTAKIAVDFFQQQAKEFARLKVCTEKNSFEARIEHIAEILQCPQADQTTIEKANQLFTSIKQHMQHQIVHESARTFFKIVSIATLIFSTCIGMRSTTLAAFDFVIATGRFGAFMYGKYVPEGVPTLPTCLVS